MACHAPLCKTPNGTELIVTRFCWVFVCMCVRCVLLCIFGGPRTKAAAAVHPLLQLDPGHRSRFLNERLHLINEVMLRFGQCFCD